jgi:hypothetical protein
MTAALLIAAAVLFTAAFAVLEKVFDYPGILASRSRTSWPRSARPRRPSVRPDRRRRREPWGSPPSPRSSGLARWPLLVPRFAADAANTDPAVAAGARDAFLLARRILGTIVGERSGTRQPPHGRC